jgi:hypothetical protein
MTPERWRQVTGVFHRALSCAPGDRPAFLRDACAHDPSLFAEVEAMLAALDAIGEAVSVPAGAVPDEMPQMPPGALVGPYRLDGWLAPGEWVRFIARKIRELAGMLPSKMLSPRYAVDAERLRRFEQPEHRAPQSLLKELRPRREG